MVIPGEYATVVAMIVLIGLNAQQKPSQTGFKDSSADSLS